MELKQLYYLIAVAESGSMHLAAERLHISWQNVSRVLKQLEQELQVPIFQKSNQGTILTSEGEKVYLRALKIIKEVHLLHEEITPAYSNYNSLRGEIIIYYSNTLNSIVDNFVFPFQKQYTEIVFSTVEFTTNEILEKIPLQETLPVAVIQLSMDKLLQKKDMLEKKYNCYLYSSEALKLVVHKDNILAKQSTISLKRLASLSFAIRTSSFNHLPEHVQTILDLGIQLNLKYCSNSEASIAKYIKQNNACSLTTNSNAFSTSTRDLVTVQIKERIYIALCVLIPKEKTPPMQIFSDYLLDNMPSYKQKLF